MSTLSIPAILPSPEEDCQRLRKAFQGFGANGKTIIEVLGHRDARNRAEITRCYFKLYNESLIERLQSELSGDFQRAVILWIEHPSIRDAKLAHKALQRKGDRDIWVVLEIACSSSSEHLIEVRQTYCSLFNSSLEEDIEFQFARQGQLKQFLLSLVGSYRYEGDEVDEQLVKSEANSLFCGIREQQQPYNEVIRVLSLRSKAHLRATFQYYKQEYGISIGEDIECNISDDNKLTSTIRATIRCLQSPEKHFAEVVRSSILGLGTDEESLTRAIVTRAEIDMKLIKEEYKNRYNKALHDDVVGDTSGYYRDFQLTLIGGN
ncbi:annexin D3-like [Phalaenopsis equestris]|uniref:annexin D3-like n=1 Tax=Phalaenopsis equestris TaxID=78828 RepID=UPI0009E3FF1E|nr:annexin D3-like [Phalaenopsis equestris]XP_020585812.1 annexin D3-like [Phalaenopsis equestris]XP_020585813.1 annexin D3-like [Phalaenopsis equestris]